MFAPASTNDHGSSSSGARSSGEVGAPPAQEAALASKQCGGIIPWEPQVRRHRWYTGGLRERYFSALANFHRQHFCHVDTIFLCSDAKCKYTCAELSALSDDTHECIVREKAPLHELDTEFHERLGYRRLSINDFRLLMSNLPDDRAYIVASAPASYFEEIRKIVGSKQNVVLCYGQIGDVAQKGLSRDPGTVSRALLRIQGLLYFLEWKLGPVPMLVLKLLRAALLRHRSGMARFALSLMEMNTEVDQGQQDARDAPACELSSCEGTGILEQMSHPGPSCRLRRCMTSMSTCATIESIRSASNLLEPLDEQGSGVTFMNIFRTCVRVCLRLSEDAHFALDRLPFGGADLLGYHS